ncbi:hypothetical protein [Risungbinella massiliensis]|uniref:hypothetical protein n=1 Tax=Risungbinella massiliensis TaxID=1329796 RepID=UPI0005CC0B6C|nr:hypothetical protein [Risungbinella massiliensis]
MTDCTTSFDEKDFEKLESLLYDEGVTFLHQFSKTEENQDVYAFAIYWNESNDELFFAINTLDCFQWMEEQKYSSFPKRKLEWITGAKYRCREFGFQYERCDFSPSLLVEWDKYCDVVRKYRNTYYEAQESKTEIDVEVIGNWTQLKERFLQVILNVYKKIENHFDLLKRSEDFIGFVDTEKWRLQDKIDWMKQTIDEKTFYRVFPEIERLENFLTDLSGKNIQEQKEFWLRAYMDFGFGLDTERTKVLECFERGKYDVETHLVHLGEEVVGDLVELIESMEKGHKRKELLRTHLLSMIRKIGKADDQSIDRLYLMLSERYAERSGQHDFVRILYIAKTLHKLRPDRYPKPIKDDRGRFSNIHEFGIEDRI